MANHPYQDTLGFEAELGDHSIQVVSKPGLPNWDRVTAPAQLIARYVELEPAGRFLYLGCGHGASAAALARSAPQAAGWLVDANQIALEMAQKTLELNHVANMALTDGLEIPEDGAPPFDDVIIDLPKGRRLAQRWLVQAHAALAPGGRLFVSGSKDEGIQPVLKDAQELFGQPAILGYKKGCRIARFVKPAAIGGGQASSEPVAAAQSPAWALQPGVALKSWFEMEIELAGRRLKMYSLPGIFAYDVLDAGTQLLLSCAHLPPGAHVLDLGCGYGAIGLYAALSGAAQVDLVDVNRWAIAAARQNLAAHGVQNAQALPSDVLQALPNRRYTHILSNPPFHAGKAVDYQIAEAFIRQSWQGLEAGGQLILVANQFIRYEQIMRPIFGEVSLLAESGSYRVLAGAK